MSRRSRIASFGLAALFVVAGGVCAVLVSGTTGQVLAMILIGIGLVGAVSLVFLEVGLSEDRERAREQAAAAERPRRLVRPRRSKLERSRGHRRRLS